MLRVYLVIAAFATLLLPVSAVAKDATGFDAWLAKLESEVVSKGISPDIARASLSGIRFKDRVIQLDRSQPESTMNLDKYLRNVLPQSRIDKARKLKAKHADLLNEASARYGVQPEFIVALWGVESNFGQNMGGFNIIESLATLAYDGRRSSYFKKELINALKILDQGHISVAAMKGSWAGAMGQCQFMPSSFLAYATDGNGDGRKDIWSTRADVFSSVANYLSSVGWDDSVGSVAKATISAEYRGKKNDLKTRRTLREWHTLGVTPATPLAGSHDGTRLALISAERGGKGQYYLVSKNFDNTLKWNRSRFFATAVGTLAEAIR